MTHSWMSAFVSVPSLYRILPVLPVGLRHVHSPTSGPLLNMATTPSPRKRAPLRAPAPAPPPSGVDLARLRRKASRIEATLTDVYPQAPRGFLDHSDPFTLLVAVVLSAQTTDTRVNMVTPALFEAAPTPSAMKDLGVERVQEFIKSVGLAPSKARALVGLSQTIDEVHGGKVPRSMDELTRLPGVGRKTASVVGAQAFGLPSFPVDTHIHRLACRWGCGDAKSVEKTEASLRMWFPNESTWAELHTRIILFGREYCPARKHDMDECPICSFAATAEARSLNKSYPNKFVPAPRHKDPFSIRNGNFGAKCKGMGDPDLGTAVNQVDKANASSGTLNEGEAPALVSRKRRRTPDVKKRLVQGDDEEEGKPRGALESALESSGTMNTERSGVVESADVGRRRSTRLKRKSIKDETAI